MAIQYGGNVDEVVEQLGTRNNGLYTNEWLIGDAKNNEIAMYELGTSHTKLWRSSKNEWFGGHRRLLLGRQQRQGPGRPPGVPARSARRARVRSLRRRPCAIWPGRISTSKYRGQIDEQFAFLAFRTAPLVSAVHHGCQGRHRGHGVEPDGVGGDRQAQPARMGAGERGRHGYAKNDGLYPSGYRLFRGEASEGLRAAIQDEREGAPGRHGGEHKADNATRRRVRSGPPLEGLGAACRAMRISGSWRARPLITAISNRPDPDLEINVRRAAYRRSADRGRVPSDAMRSKRPKACYFWTRCAGAWATTPS